MDQLRKFSTTLINELHTDPQFMTKLQANPQTTLKAIEAEVRQAIPDTWVYRIVVLAIGVALVSIVIGVLVMVATGNYKGEASLPTMLTAIGSTALGALAGLLAPSPKS